MGSAQSLVSAAAVLAIVSAIAYGFARPGDPTASLPSSSGTQAPVASTSSKKKQKKKPTATAALSDAKESVPAEPNVVSFPPVVPGEFAPSSEPADQPQSGASTAKAAKKKKKAKKASSPVPQDAQSESSATAPESSTARKPRKSATPKPAPPAEDEGWTKVGTKKKATTTTQRTGDGQGAASSSAADRPQPPEISTSDAGITTSVTTGNSSPVTERTEDEAAAHSSLLAESPSENRRTLAEKLLPKPRKTGVEDLLEKPDYPQVARVMRIQPRPDERPAAGFSWADYEDVDDSRVTADDADGSDDGGWGVVRSRRSRPKQPASGPGQAPTPQTAPETLTKKQRQHAARREAEKAAKAQAEAERLATLAQHKRELEKARMAEQAKASKKQVSGGMSAYVDENGKLVWQ